MSSVSSQPTTSTAPLDLGGNVSRGNSLLSATLNEMMNIRKLGVDLSNNHELLFHTRVQFDALKTKGIELQNNRKTLNPFKAVQNSREARMFRDACSDLYRETQMESERIQRQLLQGVPGAEMHVVDDVVPVDAIITGIAIDLPGALDDDAPQMIIDGLAVTQMENEMSLADTASLLSHGSGVSEV